MSNPFFQPSLDLINKRDRWDKLTKARKWVKEYYHVSEINLVAKQFEASALVGYSDAMSCLTESMKVPSIEDFLDWIDLQLALLEDETK